MNVRAQNFNDVPARGIINKKIIITFRIFLVLFSFVSLWLQW